MATPSSQAKNLSRFNQVIVEAEGQESCPDCGSILESKDLPLETNDIISPMAMINYQYCHSCDTYQMIDEVQPWK